MKKTTAALNAVLFSSVALSAVALAGMHGAHGYATFTSDLSEMDTDQDAVVSFGEYEQFHSKNLKAAFDMLDANNDNVIDEAEWEQFLTVHGMSETR